MADTLQGGTDTLQGGTDTLQGGTDTLKGGTDTLQGGLTLYRGDGPYAMGWVSDVMQRLENGHYTRGERTLYKGGRTLKLGVPQFLRGVEIFSFCFEGIPWLCPNLHVTGDPPQKKKKKKIVQ